MEVVLSYPNEYRNMILFAGGDYERVINSLEQAGRKDLAQKLIDLSEFSLYQKEEIRNTGNMLLDFKEEETIEVEPDKNSLAYHISLLKQSINNYSNNEHPLDIHEITSILKEDNVNVASWSPNIKEILDTLKEDPFITETKYPYEGYFLHDNKRPLSYQNYKDIIAALKDNETVNSALLHRVERSLMPFYAIPINHNFLDLSDITFNDDGRMTGKILEELKTEMIGNNGWLRDFDPQNKQQARRVITSPTKGDTYFTVLARSLTNQKELWEEFFSEGEIALNSEKSVTGEAEVFYLADVLNDIEEYNKAHTANYENSANKARMEHFKETLALYQSRRFSLDLSGTEKEGNFIVKDNRVIKYIGTDETVTIPENIKIIDKYAFYNTAAKNITVPSTVQECREKAFAKSNIEKVTLSNENIGVELFSNCPNLKEVTFLTPCTKIPKRTFLNCTSLETIKMPKESNPSIWEDAFRNTNMSLIQEQNELSKSNVLLSRNQFNLLCYSKEIKGIQQDYSNEYELYLENHLPTVEEFISNATTTRDNYYLDDLHDWGNNKEIKEQAQLYCQLIEKFNIDRGEENIIDTKKQFQFFTDTIHSIKNGTIINEIEKLEEIDPLYNFQTLNPLHPDKDLGIRNPKTNKNVNFHSLKKEIEKNFKNAIKINDYLIDMNGTIISYDGKLEGKLQIPETVNVNNKTITITKIGEGAFYNASKDENPCEVILPSSLKHIGDGAFSGCNIRNFEFQKPSQLESIGNNAFEKNALESITLPNTTKKLGKYLFTGCNKLQEVKLPQEFNYNSQKRQNVLPKGFFMNCKELQKLDYLEPFQTESLAFYGTDLHCDSVVKISKSKRTATFIYENLGQKVALSAEELLQTTDEEFEQILNQRLEKIPSTNKSIYKELDTNPKQIVEAEIKKGRAALNGYSLGGHKK